MEKEWTSFLVRGIEFYIEIPKKEEKKEDIAEIWEKLMDIEDHIWKIQQKLYISEFSKKAPREVMEKEENKLNFLYKEEKFLLNKIYG